ncbi:SGNH/GDSL hydrolase family protein [Isoalcanivorax beigongshangi]|uniref:SGNH/GDSL hydrolase family protein n=1 Tax=Isoalcanivorax beigongshangi TaxID=3238810 RepID=A0ABV4AID7_9GAMM
MGAIKEVMLLAALAPVLLVQGKRVRRDTPRLPEADGPRQGGSGAAGWLIVGDSAAAGVGVDLQQQALSGALAAAWGDGVPRWQLEAETGLTLGQLVERLQRLPPLDYPLAVVSIGVNDVTARTDNGAWQAGLCALQQVLVERHGVDHVVITAVPPMQLFSALPQPLAWYLGRRAGQLNRLTAHWCRQRQGVELFQPQLPAERAMLAADGFHPGAAGYALWAQALAPRLRALWTQYRPVSGH